MRVVFVGTGAIGLPTLRALLGSAHPVVGVVTQPDKPVGRDQRLEAPPVKQELAGSSVPVFQPPRIKDPSAIEEIRNWKPDLIVVMAYGQILPPGVLGAPRLACVNLHASLLPRWRGAAPIQAAIAAGDTRTGITLMHVDEGLDTGDIILEEAIEISNTDTGGTLHDRLAQLAPRALFNALPLLESGKAPRLPQDATNSTYAPKLNRESGRINWSEPAEVIEQKVRAFNPWPGAFTEINIPGSGGRKLKVFSAAVTNRKGNPGQFVQSDAELVIAAGSDAISLLEVQLEGRKRMSAVEFMRGTRLDHQL